ncbi:hypothetical protein glysoja_033915 [Glycine soja]|uniref:Uncharacterized protein n=1 Tax=Glycine soja TaxID=3848 RepID=A0A0B2SDT4_GLYSO|nr:hypothetical protein glysoja_033915 [Glycine soja]
MLKVALHDDRIKKKAMKTTSGLPDALNDVDKEEDIIVESSSSGNLVVEVDVVGQWGTFLLFLPFSGAFSVHDRDIVGGTKGGNDSSWMAIGFTFDVLE